MRWYLQGDIDLMEAWVGFAPTHNGFADRSLATWVPRQFLLAC